MQELTLSFLKAEVKSLILYTVGSKTELWGIRTSEQINKKKPRLFNILFDTFHLEI